MQQNDETRFEDFVGLISGLYKEIQRIKTSEGARLGLKGSDVMCLHYLERSKDGLTGADLARMAGVTRAAVSRTPRIWRRAATSRSMIRAMPPLSIVLRCA